MAQIKYRANLSSAIFPMVIAEGGRTTIIPQQDQNFDRRVDPAGEQKDAGIPQALYLENVMPTVSGYQSVGYIDPGVAIATPLIDPGYFLAQVWELKAGTPTGSVTTIPVFVFKPRTAGPLQFRAGIFGTGTVTISGTVPTVSEGWSVAVVRGVAYLLAGTQLYTVTCDPQLGTATLTNITASVTPAGFFSTAGIRFILSSNNYLIAVSATTVYYSSTTTATDFVSSLVTGAGQQDPNDADGVIIIGKSAPGGFYLFTSSRTLYVQYTGNFRFPWKYTTVRGSQGVRFLETSRAVYGDSSTSGIFAVEEGLQLKFLQGDEARAVAPEVTDYLTRIKQRDTFESSTNTFGLTPVSVQEPSVYLWLNRFLLVSCDETVNPAWNPLELKQYQTVLLYDLLLQRYGRLKIPHAFVFFVEAQLIGSADHLAFVDLVANRVRYLSLHNYFNEPLPTGFSYLPHTGVFLLGKVQLVRSRKLKLEGVDIEGPQHTSVVTPSLTVHDIPSQDGRNFLPAVPLQQKSVSGGLAEYYAHNTAENHSILLKGNFILNTVQMSFSVAGGR